jgi:hypothetical protein
MRAIRSPLLATLLIAFASACGGDGPTAPPAPVYPLVQGVYDYSAPISELPGSKWSGSMTILHGSKDVPDFSGTFTVNLIGPDGRNYGSGNGNITMGKVAASGAVTFEFGSTDWRMSGTMSGASIAGTWLLRGDRGNNYTGNFTALRR